MEKYVVDTSVIIEYVISGPFTASAEAFFEQSPRSNRLIVPEFCLLECTNVLWKQIRFNKMPLNRAEILLGDLRKLKLRRVPMKHLLERSLGIAVRNQLAVYDSGFIALAKHYECPLITIDQPQLRAAEGEGVAVIPLTRFNP